MPVKVVPAARARSEDSWMVGPSAMGSENGTPSSIISAPAPSRRWIISSVVARSGSPAVIKVTRAFASLSFSAVRRRVSLLIVIVSGVRTSNFEARHLFFQQIYLTGKPADRTFHNGSSFTVEGGCGLYIHNRFGDHGTALRLRAAGLANLVDHCGGIFGCVCNQAACKTLFSCGCAHMTCQLFHPFDRHGDQIAATGVLTGRSGDVTDH